MSEEELVEKIQSGDMNAFEKIFEIYKNQAFRYSYLITGNMHTSEDIVQEAFIKCYTCIHDLKKSDQFKSWFFKILTRIAWKYSNKDKKACPVDNIFEKAETETVNKSVDTYIKKQEYEILHAEIEKLDLKQKTVIILFYFNGLNVKEIAKVMGCFEGTVKSRLHSARKDITEFPKENIVEKRVGFSPKYVESFSNGFKFESFNSSTDKLENNNKSVIVSTKSACFKYKKDGSAQNQDLNFSAEKIEEQYASSHKFCDEPVEYNGIKIYYSAYKYKAVPESYRVTEEEQKMIDDGSLQVGYGDPSSEIEEYNIQNVLWYEDGIEYSIMNWDYDDLTKDQMIDMAKQVIDK